MKYLAKKIVLKLEEYCKKNNKVFIITGQGTTEPYLVRYLLLQNNYFSIYVHRFMRSDHDIPHSHPWHFISYVVEGEYSEHFYKQYKDTELYDLKKNSRLTGSWAFRKSTDIHKVVLSNGPYTMEQINNAPLTICFIGPRHREWGFVEFNKLDLKNKYKFKAFTIWKTFLGIDDTQKRG